MAQNEVLENIYGNFDLYQYHCEYLNKRTFTCCVFILMLEVATTAQDLRTPTTHEEVKVRLFPYLLCHLQELKSPCIILISLGARIESTLMVYRFPVVYGSPQSTAHKGCLYTFVLFDNERVLIDLESGTRS